MRCRILISLLVMLMGNSIAGAGNFEKLPICGNLDGGLVLCLSQTSGGAVLAEIRNVGTEDTVLNLGIMLANGHKQYPTALQLVVTDQGGTDYRPVMDAPGIVAGRMDPFVVPLPAGASYIVHLQLSKIDQVMNPSKQYTARVEFKGKAVPQEATNLDSKGIALMPYWTGTTTSNTIPLRLPMN